MEDVKGDKRVKLWTRRKEGWGSPDDFDEGVTSFYVKISKFPLLSYTKELTRVITNITCHSNTMLVQ